MLVSQMRSEKTRSGEALKLSFIDVVKAYFNGKPLRSLFVRLPPDLGGPKSTVGKRTWRFDGTRGRRLHMRDGLHRGFGANVL